MRNSAIWYSSRQEPVFDVRLSLPEGTVNLLVKLLKTSNIVSMIKMPRRNGVFTDNED